MSYDINKLKVTIAVVFHLLPFRTEKLSPLAPMVLHLRESRSLPNFMPLPITGKRLFILIQIYINQGPVSVAALLSSGILSAQYVNIF